MSMTICLFLFSSYSFAQGELEDSPYVSEDFSESDTLSEDFFSDNLGIKQVFSMYFPDCGQTLSFDECKEMFKENIMQHGRFFSRILAYAAVREEDVSLCDDINEMSELCPDTFEILMSDRKMGENKCDDLPSGEDLVCANMDNCDGQTEVGMKDMCNGYRTGNISLIKKGIELSSEGQDWDADLDENEIRESLSIYYGFRRNGSWEACKKYALGLEGQSAYLCDVLFGEEEIEDILDSAADDLTHYILSEYYGDGYLCNEIENYALRAGCVSAERERYFENHF
ncbi:MAG: hypothetical protein KAR32_10665 [Candidatus Omnitrophica bacterium]|nr:hypothetical protein [Candidatus Omnitrophota bacterium]